MLSVHRKDTRRAYNKIFTIVTSGWLDYTSFFSRFCFLSFLHEMYINFTIRKNKFYTNEHWQFQKSFEIFN